MKLPVLLSLVATVVPVLAGAEQAYKWTDEKGQVHYSDVVPEGKKAVAKPITPGVGPSEKDRKLAEERFARDKEILAASAPVAASGVPPAQPVDPRPQASSSKLTCEEAWKAYNESYACFNPYRISEGRVKQEAFAHCVQVTLPVDCPVPSEH